MVVKINLAEGVVLRIVKIKNLAEGFVHVHALVLVLVRARLGSALAIAVERGIVDRVVERIVLALVTEVRVERIVLALVVERIVLALVVERIVRSRKDRSRSRDRGSSRRGRSRRGKRWQSRSRSRDRRRRSRSRDKKKDNKNVAEKEKKVNKDDGQRKRRKEVKTTRRAISHRRNHPPLKSQKQKSRYHQSSVCIRIRLRRQSILETTSNWIACLKSDHEPFHLNWKLVIQRCHASSHAIQQEAIKPIIPPTDGVVLDFTMDSPEDA